MRFLLETIVSVIGLAIFFIVALLIPGLFWFGFLLFLVLEVLAFALGYWRESRRHMEEVEEELLKPE